MFSRRAYLRSITRRNAGAERRRGVDAYTGLAVLRLRKLASSSIAAATASGGAKL